MNKKNDLKILKFPNTQSQLERQVEAILFAAEEPLDVESIKEKAFKNHDFKGIINIEFLKNKDYIKVIITDNGIGFPKKNIENITKPYFTTKKNGTGLGLPIVNKIINDHNGNMTFLKSDDGAKIEILLPI